MVNREAVDLNSDAWCDLVFEGRNQEYGAYYLRKTSSKRHLFALLIVIAVTVIIFLPLPEIIHFNSMQQRDEYEELKPIELSDLIAMEESSSTPQIKPEEKPVLKDVVKFTPPTIVKDESIEDIQKELQETKPLAGTDSTDTFSASKADSLLHQEIIQLNLAEKDESISISGINNQADFSNEKTALLRYIYQNIHYPPVALKQRISGRVVYSFIINKDGTISDINMVQGVYSFLDDEVLRVIRSMPVWTPIMKDGKAVTTKCIVPVVFKL